MKTIAIVGAGVMGSGTALNFACAGYRVLLKDLGEEQLAAAQKSIRDDLRMVKMMVKEYAGVSGPEVLGRISFQTGYEGFGEAAFVIENIGENFEAKRAEYGRLSSVVAPEALFMLNTSCIPITRLAACLPRADLVIGTHFMNPVPLKKMVEVVRGFHTSEETIERTKAALATVGKKAIVVNDFPGFVSNRLSHLFMNEAAFLVQDGVATPEQIDMIFKQGFGHQMGPLETADLIGLDTVVDSLKVLYESYQDSKFRVCPLLKKMVDAGRLGRKVNQGFFQY